MSGISAISPQAAATDVDAHYARHLTVREEFEAIIVSRPAAQVDNKRCCAPLCPPLDNQGWLAALCTCLTSPPPPLPQAEVQLHEAAYADSEYAKQLKARHQSVLCQTPHEC